MTNTIGNITFGAIKNVRKSGDEAGVYFADVEMGEYEGAPMEFHSYCARDNDTAPTGVWVYQQIISGNIIGEITQMEPSPPQDIIVVGSQSNTQGVETL